MAATGDAPSAQSSTAAGETSQNVEFTNETADINKFLFSTDVEALARLTKQQMLDLIIAQAHTLIRKKAKRSDAAECPKTCDDNTEDVAGLESSPRKQVKTSKSGFDFSRYMRRHVALKFLYLGWDYQGYCIQEDNEKTIEAALFEALIRTRLIERRETSNYHRCGRTDKGVSAFSQVISIDVRSNLREGPDLFEPEGYDADRSKHTDTELDYVGMLNRVLPTEIRVIAWAPVKPGLSARFDCKLRMYKYFFPRGRLNIDGMREAASYLEGEHDFRNLCKMDVGNGVVEFVRRVDKVWIETSGGSEDDPNTMCCFCIRANAFLWHQIRCIVSVLVFVGEGNESPSIVQELLDVKKHPRKPQYPLASEVPLCLYEAQYDCIEWVYDTKEVVKIIDSLQRTWTMCSIKSAMIQSMVSSLSALSGHQPMNHADPLLPSVKPKHYKKLLDRPKCESLEDRIFYYERKGKVMKRWSRVPTTSALSTKKDQL